jgi:TRAP-type C4-dicarboxylate transport system permease small subunit
VKTLWNLTIEGINRIVQIAVIIGFSVLVVLVMMQIIWRYVLEIPLPWSDEAVRYLLVWVTLLSIAVAHRNDSHIRLDFFVQRLPRIVRRIVWILFNGITFAFLLLLLIYGIPHATLGRFTYSPGLGITLFAAYVSVPTAAGVMLLNHIDYVIYNAKSMEVGDIREAPRQ